MRRVRIYIRSCNLDCFRLIYPDLSRDRKTYVHMTHKSVYVCVFVYVCILHLKAVT